MALLELVPGSNAKSQSVQVGPACLVPGSSANVESVFGFAHGLYGFPTPPARPTRQNICAFDPLEPVGARANQRRLALVIVPERPWQRFEEVSNKPTIVGLAYGCGTTTLEAVEVESLPGVMGFNLPPCALVIISKLHSAAHDSVAEFHPHCRNSVGLGRNNGV